MKALLLLAIRFYQKYLSFDSGVMKWLFPNSGTCRFSPRCSDYTYQAILKHGTIKGAVLGVRRILRCQPWNSGGFDPVP